MPWQPIRSLRRGDSARPDPPPLGGGGGGTAVTGDHGIMRFKKNDKALSLPFFLYCMLSASLAARPARAQMGIAYAGVGPINSSMGGAATAAPLDSIGALSWNPATIGDLGRSEMAFGTGILIPRSTISSRVPAGSFGNGFPAKTTAGTTGGNNGVFLIPSIGLVFLPESSPWAYGLGVYNIGGTATNYPVSSKNLVLNAGGPFGVGVGPLFSQLQIIQFSPTVSYKLNDQWWVGAQPNIAAGSLPTTPAVTSPPALTQFSTLPAYLSGTQGRSRAGGGFQVGVYYKHDENWSFGASIKSPQ